jgi:hypothetical protein
VSVALQSGHHIHAHFPKPDESDFHCDSLLAGC